MKLGYLVPEFPAQTHAFFWREVQALRGLGHEVHLLSTRRPDPSACRHAFAQQATRETKYLYPPTLEAAVAAATAARHLPAVVAYLATLTAANPRERAQHLGLAACAAELVAVARRLGLDHVHIHSAASAAHLGALAHLMGGPPYSITVHGDLPVYGTDHAQKFRDAKLIVPVTRPLLRQVMDVGVPAERVKVIWMGVDCDRFTPPAEHPDGPLRLTTVARLHPNKGHRFALQAMRRLKDAGLDSTYTIAGAGEAKAELEATVRSLDLESAVTFAGTISEDDVLALLRRTDVFLLPSVGLGEAAPVSVMEAMSCGCVAVVSRIGGTPDLIVDGQDGFLIEQTDVDGLARSLERLAREPALRRSVGAAGRAKAIAEFDCRKTAGALARAIDPAAGAGARP